MGRITGIGKNTLRAILVEASCTLISKDQTMREKYDRIKIRSGGKRHCPNPVAAYEADVA